MDVSHQGLIDEFWLKRDNYINFGASMHALISRLINISGINTHSVHYRVKEINSLKDKIELKNKYSSLDEITDIVGVRVITYYATDIEKIEKIINENFTVDTKNTIDKRRSHELDRFGYMSLHYVVSIDNKRSSLVEYSGLAGVKFEIQIRTILQHTWAEIEHDLGYKNKHSVPDDIRRKFYTLSGSLELIDNAFVDIYKSLSEYSAQVKEDAGSDNETDKESHEDINNFYMRGFVTHSKLFNKLYDSYLSIDPEYKKDSKSSFCIYPNNQKGDEVNYHKIIKNLKDLGINTTTDLKKFIKEISLDKNMILAVSEFKKMYSEGYLSKYFFLLFMIYLYAYNKNTKDNLDIHKTSNFIDSIGDIYDRLSN